MGTRTAGGGSPTAESSIQRVRISVEYEAGGADSVVLRPVALVAAERHYKGQLPGIEGSLWAAWWQLAKESPSSPAAGSTFGDWLDSLAAIDESAEVPTSAAASAQ